MNRRLYVNNIPWGATDDDLRAWLSGLGYQVDEVKIIMNRENGRSRGFGFVTFRTDADAIRGLRELDGMTYLKRSLHVAEAMPKKPMTGRSESSPASRQDAPARKLNGGRGSRGHFDDDDNYDRD
jgi:cold-inducible RNA-binding protein